MSSTVGEIVHEVKRSPWRLGVVFFDPDDSRLIVRQRTGLGWTLNFGKPLAWAIASVFLFVIVRNGKKNAAGR